MREAIDFRLEGLRLDGDPVPPPHATAARRRTAPIALLWT